MTDASLPALLADGLERLGCRRGETVLMAVSGGPDSVACCHALACSGRFPLIVCYVAHGLRTAHDDLREEELVRRLAASLSLPVVVVRETPGAIAARVRRDGGGIEREARRTRYRLLADSARGVARWVATAHHRDDQVETIAQRLLGGRTPLDPLGMPARRGLDPGIDLVRPALDHSRATLRAYVESNGLRTVDDPTNADETFRRNAIRHRVLPALRAYHPEAERALVRLEERLVSMRAALETLIPEDAWGSALGADGWRFSRRTLAVLPVAARELVVRRALYLVAAAVGETRASAGIVGGLIDGSDLEGADGQRAASSRLVVRVAGDRVELVPRVVRSGESGYLEAVPGGACIRVSRGRPVATVTSDGASRVGRHRATLLAPLTKPVVVRSARSCDRLRDLHWVSGPRCSAEPVILVVEDGAGIAAAWRRDGSLTVRPDALAADSGRDLREALDGALLIDEDEPENG